jgi:hypothetical protein
MIWVLAGNGVLTSEFDDAGRYAQVYPEDRYRELAGHKQQLERAELYPNYAWVATQAHPVDVRYGGGLVGWGSLEECMNKCEWALATMRELA